MQFCNFRRRGIVSFRMRFLMLVLGVALFASQVAGQFRGDRGGSDGPATEPGDLDIADGVGEIPDHETFDTLSYKGTEVGIDGYLANRRYVKFIIVDPGTEETRLYFMNTKRHKAHPRFMSQFGLSRDGAVRGAITHLPRAEAPDGERGLYIFDFQPNSDYRFEEIRTFQRDLVRFMPVLRGRIAFHPLPGNMQTYRSEQDLYENSEVEVCLENEIYWNVDYLSLNAASSYGYLRILEEGDRPGPRDIVICRTLPNELSRVAGVITEERQTPLSHVNLRAVQDRIPNAYVGNALQDPRIRSLLGRIVRFEVKSEDYELREATFRDMERHFEGLRPGEPRSPDRDLSVRDIRSLEEIRFEDAAAFGSKTANLGAMHSFDDLPEQFPNQFRDEGATTGILDRFEDLKEDLPGGHGIPFHFYVEFVKANGLGERVEAILGDEDLLDDREDLSEALKELRGSFREGTFPDPLHRALGELQQSFPQGVNLRCRSSTNNEDLPGFSGAGLYGSYTHRPEEGHLSRTIAQVYASLWNLRAFEERRFHRIEHRLAAMGVLVHPSYRRERVNGVAVTDDILYKTRENYYINTQVGEDLVTNPEAGSRPEEILLGWRGNDHEVVRYSDQVTDRTPLLQPEHLRELRSRLGSIHFGFALLCGKDWRDGGNAMEIEFKITEDNRLVIKQARPWVY